MTAIREDFRGPLFIQGDHFQVSASAYYKGDREKELAALRALIEEALAAGFLNIDIDSSTLVVLERPTLDEQQVDNCRIAAELTSHVHKHAPAGVKISIGGEIGEVGGKNSTVEELRAYMRGYRKHLDEIAPGSEGISKISVQTGTSHGGIPLPDGTVAKVAVDFDTLRELSIIARKEYGMAGAVQHGASTLPEDLFGKFPEVETAEIHLATGFQNLIYDHPQFPRELRDVRTPRESPRRRAQAGHVGPAVLLQDAQVGARAVQAPDVGPADVGARGARRRSRAHVRQHLHAPAHPGHARRRRQVREADADRAASRRAPRGDPRLSPTRC